MCCCTHTVTATKIKYARIAKVLIFFATPVEWNAAAGGKDTLWVFLSTAAAAAHDNYVINK